MKNNRLVVEVVTQLIQRVEALETKQNHVDEGLTDVDKQVKRLAKEIYKSNLMNASSEETNIQDLIQELREEYTRQETKAITEKRLEIFQSFLPILDTVEAGLKSGRSQLKLLQKSHPDATRILYAWLNGQRLLRERLLKLLESEEIYPMKTSGEKFDPYRHVAVKAVSIANKAPDMIVRVERPGYVHDDYVLRFADVVVNKPGELVK